MKVAIVGCGAAGADLADAALRAECTICACVDRSRSAARAFADRFDTAPTTWNALTKRSDLDAVFVATPTAKHEAIVLETIAAKLPILVAAPLAPTLAAASKLRRAARRAKVALGIGPLSRHDPAVAAITARLRSGAVGKPGFVRVMRSGPAPQAKRYAKDSQAGGVLLNELLVDFEWIARHFGTPTRVYCQRVQRSRPVYMDYTLVTLRLPKNCIAQLIGSWAHASAPRHRLEICGDEGMIQFDSAQRTVAFEARSPDAASNEDTPTVLGAHDRFVREFLEGIKSGENSERDDSVFTALAIADAAARSAATDRAVKVSS